MYVFGAMSEPAASVDEQAAEAAAALRRYVVWALGGSAWLTGVAAVRMPNGQRVIEVGLHPGLGRQTLPEIPSQVGGFPVIMTRNVVSLADPRRMVVSGGWPLTHYGLPIGR